MLVICDTYDWDDFPKYVPKGEDPRKFFDDYVKQSGNAYRAEECYDLRLPSEPQLAESRSNHWSLEPEKPNGKRRARGSGPAHSKKYRR